MKTIELLYNYNLSGDENVIRSYSINKQNKQNKEKINEGKINEGKINEGKINEDSVIQKNEKTTNKHINNYVYDNIEEDNVKESQNINNLKNKINEDEQNKYIQYINKNKEKQSKTQIDSQINTTNMDNTAIKLLNKYDQFKNDNIKKENIFINHTNSKMCEKIKNIKKKQSPDCYESTHILGIEGKGENQNMNDDHKLNDSNKCDKLENDNKKNDLTSSLNNMNDQNGERNDERGGENDERGDRNDERGDRNDERDEERNDGQMIDNIKLEIKKEIYKKLKIAFNTNMQFNIIDQYYIKFRKKKKFRKYVLNTSNFIIILGKYLRLSFSTIAMALYYMHKYNKKKLAKKNKPINYIIAGSCIFLAWKLREDFEQCKKSQKLYDIPKGIFKLLNYFYKKKIIKKKIKQIQPNLIYNHKNCYEIKNDDTFDTLIEMAKKKNEILKCTHEHNKNVNVSENSTKNKKKRKINTQNEDIKKNAKHSYHLNKEEDEEKKHYINLYNQLKDLNNIIIDTGYISDINNISDVSDLFNSYLSECNSDDLSEYNFSPERGEEAENEAEKEEENDAEKKDTNKIEHHNLDQLNTNEENSDILKNAHIDKNAYIQKFKKLCKKKKKNINISSSKWVLNNSGQKLQLIQKAMIYYEGEILKSFNYFIKPKILSFELIPFFITNFVSIMNDYIQPNQIPYLQKLSSLIILDFYKTPLCLIFPPKEILIVCIIKGYISLKLINSELDLQAISLENFENKIKEYVQSVSGDIPIE
ncbi:cyclin-like protein [Plasmodium yoelii yoelii]|uniref:Cyclin-like protein n=1 Tax=Plasmodium yoelii yoelii TaxID=73239 RepID=A0AAE9WSL0_PLAYO|nr:cyclin-like protein [Plasmodium yoelii yoelii]